MGLSPGPRRNRGGIERLALSVCRVPPRTSILSTRSSKFAQSRLLCRLPLVVGSAPTRVHPRLVVSRLPPIPLRTGNGPDRSAPNALLTDRLTAQDNAPLSSFTTGHSSCPVMSGSIGFEMRDRPLMPTTSDAQTAKYSPGATIPMRALHQVPDHLGPLATSAAGLCPRP